MVQRTDYDIVKKCSCERSTDYIIVRDGIDEDAELMAIYCSSVSDAAVTSSSETLAVELVTDEKKQRQGFSAVFDFVPDDDSSHSAKTDIRHEALSSGGLVADFTSTTHHLQTARQQFSGVYELRYTGYYRFFEVLDSKSKHCFPDF